MNAPMTFFFVHDHLGRRRFFSTDPVRPPDIRFSKSRKAWEKARSWLLSFLPARILRQEQAFGCALTWNEGPLPVLHGGAAEPDRAAHKLVRFLRSQKRRHVLLMVVEAILLPLTGFAAFLPGPNILFYAPALFFLLQVKALRGLGRALRLEHDLRLDPLLAEWETAVKQGASDRYAGLLARLEESHGLTGLRKVLWK
jgi:hypothetical protein